ncbi:hypothetical protein K1719_034891 [Acacia pycnantha]|nr:hypothetical protein K1719_034891 [Acacia pycnantha]
MLEPSGTRTIPESFGNMKRLKSTPLDGRNITGKLPNFIGNWIELHHIGTSMEGPIPTTIPQLTKLNLLIISYLQGPATLRFPNLESLTLLKYLDSSFNKLIGEIPNNKSDLIYPRLPFMFCN